MYIRTVKKQRSKTSKVFYQYTLAQTLRADGKVKQRAILYLGSDPLLEDRANRATVLRLLKAKIFRRSELFEGEGPENQAPEELRELAGALHEKYRIKYGNGPSKNEASIPPAPARAEYHNIDIKSLEVADVKTFGAEHLCRQVLDKLQLHYCFLSLGMTEKQSDKALLSIAARAIFSSSEHRTAQILRANSALQECFGIERPITHKQLYTVADTLLGNKEKIDAFLYDRIGTLFDLEDKLVIFDISNTYFEGRKAGSKIAKYGRSKEKRSDCPLVVFTGVINAEGFIRHSRIYEGNKADTATLDDMIADLEKYGPADVRQTIVIDAGIATDENLESIKNKGYKYICVSRKRLKDYPVDPQKPTITQLTDRDRNKVELRIFRPKDHTDTWMYVQSQAKETSMDEKLKKRFEEELGQIKNALHTKGGTKKINKVWERIGRAKEKNKHVSSKYTIGLTEKEGLATAIAGRRLLTGSDYVTHLGDHGDFVKKMDYHLENLNKPVFIADGARWIWKWVERNHPESTQIVDYYHSKEHLCEFAKLYFRDEKERHRWIDAMAQTMLDKGIDPVIEEIESLPGRQGTDGKRNRLINYYRRNRDRMQYHGYTEKGLLIGSGAIESAHRDVLQQRLKLSGQRWTVEGFQQVAQLRVVHKSGQWGRIRELCQKAA